MSPAICPWRATSRPCTANACRQSPHGALERLHEGNLFGVIHFEPLVLFNKDQVTQALGPLTSMPVRIAFSISARSRSYCSLVQYSEAEVRFDRNVRLRHTAKPANVVFGGVISRYAGPRHSGSEIAKKSADMSSPVKAEQVWSRNFDAPRLTPPSTKEGARALFPNRRSDQFCPGFRGRRGVVLGVKRRF